MKTNGSMALTTQKSSWPKSGHIISLRCYPAFIYVPNFGITYTSATVGVLPTNLLHIVKNMHKGNRSEIGQFRPQAESVSNWSTNCFLLRYRSVSFNIFNGSTSNPRLQRGLVKNSRPHWLTRRDGVGWSALGRNETCWDRIG